MRIALSRWITRRTVEEPEKVLAMMEGEKDCIRWRDLNFLFHALLYEPADRPLTVDMVARLRQKTDRNIRSHLDSMRTESERQHREILRSVDSGDMKASVAALKHHLDYTSSDLQSWMRSEGDIKNRKKPRMPGRPPRHRV